MYVMITAKCSRVQLLSSYRIKVGPIAVLETCYIQYKCYGYDIYHIAPKSYMIWHPINGPCIWNCHTCINMHWPTCQYHQAKVISHVYRICTSYISLSCHNWPQYNKHSFCTCTIICIIFTCRHNETFLSFKMHFFAIHFANNFPKDSFP